MSSFTSVRGTEFESKFIEGFSMQNAHVINNGGFVSYPNEGKIFSKSTSASGVITSTGQALGDIDGHFITTSNCLLTDLLPSAIGLADRSIVIPVGTNVFCELTTTEGRNLQNNDNGYIEKKMRFHRQLLDGNGFDFNVPPNHFLLFIFNGADHVGVNKIFQALKLKYRIEGISVFISNTSMVTWPLELRELTAALEAAQQLELANRELTAALEAAQRLELANRELKAALEAAQQENATLKAKVDIALP